MIKTSHINAAFNKCNKEDRNIDFHKPTGQTAEAVVTLKRNLICGQDGLYRNVKRT